MIKKKKDFHHKILYIRTKALNDISTECLWLGITRPIPSSETQGLLVIFSAKSLLQEQESPLAHILPEPVPEVFELIPLIGQKNILFDQHEVLGCGGTVTT